MPAIKFSEVLSFSSEDPNHPADNLLRADAFRKWKCAAGSSEKQATVTLKLEHLTSINSIDIGNEGSAFVEVLVAREGATDFQVLLVASSFMTPIESRNGSDLNRVRMFGMDKLNKNVAEQKWDRVKVICTQPFNKKTQYGLSFVTVRAPDQEASGSAGKVTKLGSFTLKDEEDTDTITAGSLFARRKDKEPSSPLSGAAAIRAASAVAAAATSASPTPHKRKTEDQAPDNTFYQLKKKPSKDENGTKKNQYKGTEERAKEKKNGNKAEKREKKEKPEVKVKEEKKGRGEKNKGETSTPKGERNKRSEKTAEKNESQRKSRPFTSLMEDVVFVLSGYQNPERSQLRDSMTEMGATYKSDWGPTCTHLICAFKNTPKYQQVQGKGRIVTAKWVTQCHKDKKRYPCHRFELEKRHGGDESEEEVWADELLPKKPRPADKDVPSARLSPKPEPDKDLYGDDIDTSDNENTDDEIERAKARKAKDTVQSPKVKNSSKAAEPPSKRNTDTNTSKKRLAEDSEASPSFKRKPKATEEDTRAMNGTGEHIDDDLFDADTDVDEEPDQHPAPPDTSSLPLPALGDYFKGKTFFVYGSLAENQKKLLTRYIIAFHGEVESYMSEKVQFVVSENNWDDSFDEALNENPSLQFVKPLWVWRCCDKKRLLPHQPYLIVPKE